MNIELLSSTSPVSRRRLMAGVLASALPGAQAVAAASAGAQAPGVVAASGPAPGLIRQGGVVLMFRHALAPGVFDPPQFRLGDCSTQRNLDAEGRAQAQRIGRWFAEQGLQPQAVRSSPWCRCLETARLAFGRAQVWDALASPVGSDAKQRGQRLQDLRLALLQAVGRPGWQAWVTHDFVVSDLTGSHAASGEGLLLRADAAGEPQILLRLNLV